MGRWEAHLFLVFSLLIMSALTFAASASSFSECYPTLKPFNFWNQGDYLSADKFIVPRNDMLTETDVYSFQFDNAEQGLGVSGVHLVGPEYLKQTLPSSNKDPVPGATSAISSAAESLSSAVGSSAEAHLLSQNAQLEFAGELT